jgi:phage gp37-like protein
MHEFEELEQIVLDTLEPIKAQGVKTLELYAGQAEANDIEELARMTLLFPCVYVVATGLALTWKDRYDEEDIGTMLIVGARNLRGTGAARLGDSTSLGVYEILEATEALLHRQKIHSSGVMLLRSAAPLYLAPKKGLCFYAARYEFKTIKR